jgi:hypothetical protein
MIVKPALLVAFAVMAVASATAPAAKMKDRVSPVISAAPAAVNPDEAEPRTAARDRRADRGEFAPGVVAPAARTVTIERRTGPNTSELVRMPAAATAELR